MKKPGIPRSIAVDIETKSTNKDAFILSIGAVAFHDYGAYKTLEECEPCVFYGQVPWNDPTQKGRHVSAETLSWWEHQGKAREALRNPNMEQEQWVYKDGLPALLSAYMQFVKEERHLGKITALGIDFDLAILDSAIEHFNLGKERSWRYSESCCFRAYKEAAHRAGVEQIGNRKQSIKEELIPHHSADDAIMLANQFCLYTHELYKIGLGQSQRTLEFIS